MSGEKWVCFLGLHNMLRLTFLVFAQLEEGIGHFGNMVLELLNHSTQVLVSTHLSSLIWFKFDIWWHTTAIAHGLSWIFVWVWHSVKLTVWSVFHGVRWCMLSALGGPCHWSITLPASLSSWPPWLLWILCFGLSLMQKSPWCVSS